MAPKPRIHASSYRALLILAAVLAGICVAMIAWLLLRGRMDAPAPAPGAAPIIVAVPTNPPTKVSNSTLPTNPQDLPSYVPRGVPSEPQQLGVLSAPAAQAGADPKILPLFGRPSATRRDRFEYYTTTDQQNMLRLTLLVDGKDCQQELGCRELYTGDKVMVPDYGKEFTVRMYELAPPARM